MGPLLGAPIPRRCVGAHACLAISLLLVAAGAAGCRDARAVRLTSHTGDTLVVNHHRPKRIALQSVDVRGRRRPASEVLWQQVGGDTLTLAADGTLHCTRVADGTVQVSRGTLRSRLFVRCRPVTGYHASSSTALRVGDRPEPFVLHPVGPK